MTWHEITLYGGAVHSRRTRRRGEIQALAIAWAADLWRRADAGPGCWEGRLPGPEGVRLALWTFGARDAGVALFAGGADPDALLTVAVYLSGRDPDADARAVAAAREALADETAPPLDLTRETGRPLAAAVVLPAGPDDDAALMDALMIVGEVESVLAAAIFRDSDAQGGLDA